MPGSPGSPDLRALVTGATAVLAEAGVPSARVDAVALAGHALGVPNLVLVMAPPLPPDFSARYAALVERRRLREPLQHITGTAAFRHLDLTVRPGVFVPRPETETVAQVAIDAAQALAAAGTVPTGVVPSGAVPSAEGAAAAVVVDLCAGGGPIALSVADEVPGARVTAVELSPEGVALTRANADRLGLEVRVLAGDVRQASLLAELDGAVDVLVSNPPYIPPDAVPIDPEVRDHDPDLALYGGGADGLEVPRAVVWAAVRLLRPGGTFVMEHAEVQAEAVRADVDATDAFTDIHTVADLTGRDRMVVATRR
ncbi:peptide chain release factor N(5)-glutamine methyltransferase [Occultella kanbiaonis]|uniref:peptide chain release factor N(5)-glutamine methyltransferase n=1 Tax=Occultella kanbiaonis TaxID=2675754 RepID=UPI00143D8AB6|nr:peptide chain release factor N(5)-glutamine methyltransferase [Occultella kanbiaonis]